MGVVEARLLELTKLRYSITHLDVVESSGVYELPEVKQR